MHRPHSIALGLVAATCVGACSHSGLPVIPPAAPQSTGQVETGAVPSPAAAPAEISTIVPGTPTEVYTRVARGALRCWFGANGPLKATHIFNAEAAPPSDGGVAEIVLHERDVALRDQRGARAFRISIVGEGGGVHVGMTPIKIGAPLAEPMVRDVETWAQGGSGCQAGALGPPAPTAAAPAKSAKSNASQSNRR